MENELNEYLQPKGSPVASHETPKQVTGEPPAGSPQYQGARGAGRADLTEPKATSGIERSFPAAQDTPASRQAAQGNGCASQGSRKEQDCSRRCLASPLVCVLTEP